MRFFFFLLMLVGPSSSIAIGQPIDKHGPYEVYYGIDIIEGRNKRLFYLHPEVFIFLITWVINGKGWMRLLIQFILNPTLRSTGMTEHYMLGITGMAYTRPGTMGKRGRLSLSFFRMGNRNGPPLVSMATRYLSGQKPDSFMCMAQIS